MYSGRFVHGVVVTWSQSCACIVLAPRNITNQTHKTHDTTNRPVCCTNYLTNILTTDIVSWIDVQPIRYGRRKLGLATILQGCYHIVHGSFFYLFPRICVIINYRRYSICYGNRPISAITINCFYETQFNNLYLPTFT